MLNVDWPPPALVGVRAAEILAALRADPDVAHLAEATYRHPDYWSTLGGVGIVVRWDFTDDGAPLFLEGLRVLALKSALYELTAGAEYGAEIAVSAPIDEMVHTLLAQYTVWLRIQTRTRITLAHATSRERYRWEPGDYTDHCYRAAGWGIPPTRYWIPAPEARRRLDLLAARFRSIGVHDGGRRHEFGFGTDRAGSGAGPHLRDG
ncbi:hypothetical protein GCM10023088_78400 [Actinomadura verrucosospora]|uniref:hypothetical protein n=1 Tax=Actinomadura verrucosospora TaxID=46165 RepID=UPI0031E753D4